MKRYIQHELLKISSFTTQEWVHPVHNHNHFEIIFVHKGKGVHCLSGMKYIYQSKSLFLLAPCDFHHFEVQEETEFTFLKFTNVYLHGMGNTLLQSQWNQHMDQLLIYVRHQPLPVIKNVQDAEQLENILRLIVKEWKTSQHELNETIFFLIQAFLSIVKRNIQIPPAPPASKHSAKITEIIHYIHQHIYSVDQTQVKHLAERFGYSRHYLGIFFKEQTGRTLRDYVNEYKLHLIENRLRYSSFSIKEISDELGFTDMSHIHKFFKSYRGINISEYRNQLINNAV
ncbi:AraC family transcriptional regulator [Cytophagaceae bacterium DM2B3-1]|uniref:AraC family transcriptional regulator n=1 Tax=Xanthocytophaga flava TaxID=3048013 RepID=A0ABT7CLT8_9BACT|nr:AraC family transcriptional regulator [Xanthocytophaga flavus]MDJ1467638.1 AraC family transcriptional regulator [Xanthocytophaga flavus]MDJ1494708.1 AraC family transcriptional regulator [Xanthocytophaga flavus]